MQLFRKIGPNQKVTAKQFNELVDFINSLRPHPQPGLRRDRLGWQLKTSGGGGIGLRRVKAQEGSQSNGLLSVKFVDKDDNVIGDAFDAYAFKDRGSTDMRDYLPNISTNDFLEVFSIAGNYYLNVDFIEKGSASDTVTPQTSTTTIFAAAMNPIGQW